MFVNVKAHRCTFSFPIFPWAVGANKSFPPLSCETSVRSVSGRRVDWRFCPAEADSRAAVNAEASPVGDTMKIQWTCADSVGLPEGPSSCAVDASHR